MSLIFTGETQAPSGSIPCVVRVNLSSIPHQLMRCGTVGRWRNTLLPMHLVCRCFCSNTLRMKGWTTPRFFDLIHDGTTLRQTIKCQWCFRPKRKGPFPYSYSALGEFILSNRDVGHCDINNLTDLGWRYDPHWRIFWTICLAGRIVHILLDISTVAIQLR